MVNALTGRDAQHVIEYLQVLNSNVRLNLVDGKLTGEGVKNFLDLNHDGSVDGRDFSLLPESTFGTLAYEDFSDADRLLKQARMYSPIDDLRRDWSFNRRVLGCWDDRRDMCAAHTLDTMKMFTSSELWQNPDFLRFAGDMNPMLKYLTPVTARQLVDTYDVDPFGADDAKVAELQRIHSVGELSGLSQKLCMVPILQSAADLYQVFMQ